MNQVLKSFYIRAVLYLRKNFKMIRYLLELMGESEFEIYPTPENNYPKNYDLYYIDLRDYPKESYWIDWGGWFNNYIGTQLEIYYGDRLLRKVYEIEEVKTVPFTMLVLPEKCILNIPKHPWLYIDNNQYGITMKYFLSTSLREDNPSFNIIRDNLDIAPIKLEIPNFSIKLSDSINGIQLNQGLSVQLNNNDGYFDNEDIWNMYNFPVYLKRSNVDNPIYTDFKIIRSGHIENTETNFNTFKIDIADRFKSMNQPVCRVITKELFPSVIFSEDKNDNGKILPVVYGTKRIKLLKLNETTFTAAEYVNEIHSVIDSDGNEIDFIYKNIENIIISEETATEAVITGYTDNKIGEIIKSLIVNKTEINFLETYFDITEFNNYTENSPRINIIIDNGNVRNAIQNVLKSDMAYFIQKINDKFTIRKYGEFYKEHKIENWLLTKNVMPNKNYDKANENFFTNCVIRYNFTDKDNFESYFFNDNEVNAKDKYNNKVVNRVFDTDLIEIEDAEKLAILLSERYSSLKQTLKISVGSNTNEYELLDRIIIDMNVNGRQISNVKNYIIKEINPSQDILTLEEFKTN